MQNPSTHLGPTCECLTLLINTLSFITIYSILQAVTNQLFSLPLNSGPVLSLAISSNGEQCFSGGIDATIQWWNMPSPSVDPYDTYGKYLLKDKQLLTITTNIIFPLDVSLFSRAFVKQYCHFSATLYVFNYLCVANISYFFLLALMMYFVQNSNRET